MATCLGCGSPLGSQLGLCYSCQQDDDVEMPQVNEDALERVERYCIVAASKCPDCGGIHPEVEVNGEIYRPEDFGIETPEDWQMEMDKEQDWITENKDTVHRAIVELQDEWPRTTAAIQGRFL